ncbi:MAG: ABC transporter ATP-binding protein [Saprospiraceae bacterium]|nr:ABC transporter ATP-binding protein [Saprospiraceae bacterium]
MEKVITAELLTKRFGSFTAVNEISFEVEQGEIFGFLGANGAGKTTAIRMLIGLSRPSGGRAIVAGFDVARQPEQVKRRIGYMSQRFTLYEDLSIRENIQLYGGIYGLTNRDIRSKSDRLIGELQLEASANALVKSLPLGWKQKLAFSVAMLHDPAIVFLDEPTGGVDPLTRRQFWEMIYAAAERGTTVFVTTHYMDEAEYCHRVSMMTEGRIAALDTPRKLREQYNAADMGAVFLKIARE